MQTDTILQGDALTVLRTLPPCCVDCCITSPPYYGLRDYGTAQWVGGSPDCDHVVREIRTGLGIADSPASIRGGGHKVRLIPKIQAQTICPKCGARRVDNQIGIEETPEAYIDNLVSIFREVKRVLRGDGTLWINIADSYAGSGKGAAHYPDNAKLYKQGTSHGMLGASSLKAQVPDGCKPKDLIGIPWMLAFALRADGWYLRQEIIWHKGNPMPESVKDRCVKSHESIFLLSKRPKYYFDYRAIQEPAQYDGRKDTRMHGSKKYEVRGVMPGNTIQTLARDGHERWQWNKDGVPVRNKRDVWLVNNHPLKAAHFATFPPKLVEPCILAGCPANGVILDCFAGAGTTALVAKQNGRHYIGIELNASYVAIARERIEKEASL